MHHVALQTPRSLIFNDQTGPGSLAAGLAPSNFRETPKRELILARLARLALTLINLARYSLASRPAPVTNASPALRCEKMVFFVLLALSRLVTFIASL